MAGKVIYVHRLVFRLEHGYEPIGVVRHSCDNPPCANGAHLLDGTRRDNTWDSLTRGRQPRTKLTWPLVAEIRERYREERTPQRALASHYGVSQRLIGRVIRNQSWPEEATP